MDILQQSLKAAEILSGDDSDDLFGQLGITFNGPLESSGSPSDLHSIANVDASHSQNSGSTTQESYGIASSFDTSQFLNTSTSVNLAQTASHGKFQIPVSTADSARRLGIKPGITAIQQPAVQYRNVPKLIPSSASLSLANHASPTVTTTVAQNVSIPTCASVYAKAPTRTLTTTVQMQPTMPLANAQAYTVPAMNSQPVQISAPIKVLQALQPHAIQQQGNTQLVTLVQKPAMMQINPGNSQSPTVVQNVNGLVVQPPQNNIAVLKIASTKAGINLNDPQVIKAITANLVPKQQPSAMHLAEANQTQPQFIKIAQNNSLLNVISQRAQQNTGVQGTQQITLPNGHKILVNNGQQMQICTTQSSSLHQQIDSTNTVTQSIFPNGAVNSNNKSNQLPIKRIQIASVNIPISSTSGGGSGTVQGNTVLTIPIVSKQDTAPHTVNNLTMAGDVTSVNSMARMASGQSSSTVRGLLGNVVQKQNNPSPPAIQLPQTATQLHNSQGQAASTLRLNLPSPQVGQLTPAQLQSLIKQHQESTRLKSEKVVENHGAGLHPQMSNIKNAAATSLASSSGKASPTLSMTSAVNSSVVDRQAVQVFKVDSSITQAQVDEVKKLLTSRTIGSKLHCLTKEQQQLVLAFQAQIKTMSPPVQQYYLRNPQLFMQKVLQQTRNGKPFILHVNADALQKAKSNNTVSLPSKSQHPTISLTNESNRSSIANSRVSSPPVTRVAMNSPQSTPKLPQRSVISVNHIAASGIKTGVKRPAPPEAPSKVTLVVEQLDCHKKMVMKPDCVSPFVSVRDAIRRLVPYHTCNIPSVEQKMFDESETMFDQISERIMVKTRAMVNKYHLLRLRDSTRDSCSADMVMIERMFLQKEKAKYVHDKARLKEDPSLIHEYFPRKDSQDDNPKDEVNDMAMEVGEDGLSKAESSESSRDFSQESMLIEGDLTSLNNIESKTVHHSAEFGGRTSGRNCQKSPNGFATGNTSHGEDSLLREAVDSILI